METLRIIVFILTVYLLNSVNGKIQLNFDNSTMDITPDKPLLSLNISSKLDVAFIMDSTGSMGSYIEDARQNIGKFVDIITNSTNDVRMALILYRDHPPEAASFVTKTHEFTSNVSVMKSWLDAASADDGGDTPEAVADALFDATKLAWRSESAKIGILISDAPPHGLSPSEDNSFKQGCPKGHDPINLTRELVKLGVTIYSVGCEPSILHYKDFFMALAYVTGGQYIPLSDPQRLIDAIIGGAQEQISMRSFAEVVQQEIQKAKAAGQPIDKDQIVQSVYQKLNTSGAQSTHLLRNNQTLSGATSVAKDIAAAKSMIEVQSIFNKEENVAARRAHYSPSGAFYSEFESAPIMADLGRMADGSFRSGAETSETYSAVKSAVSFDQIDRLVTNQVAQAIAV